MLFIRLLTFNSSSVSIGAGAGAASSAFPPPGLLSDPKFCCLPPISPFPIGDFDLNVIIKRIIDSNEIEISFNYHLKYYRFISDSINDLILNDLHIVLSLTLI